MTNFETNINVGKLGEEELSKWCTEAGLTANRSLEEDKMGWDHLIEFPYEKSDKPKDKQNSPIECKIQVKSTRRNDRGVNIKLSSLKRLVDYSSPAFILFYEYETTENCNLLNAYLIHFDKQLISRVLKRIRKNEVSNTPKALNKIKLRISYNNKHLLEENSGIALRNLIYNYVPKGMANYQKEKYELVKKVGYENGGYELTFKAKTNELDDYFLERVIGNSNVFEVENAVIMDKRFGLKGINIDIQKGSINFKPNSLGKCQFHFRQSSYSPAVTFKVNLIKIPHLKYQSNKLLFKSDLFTIAFEEIDSKGQVDAKLYITINHETTLDECIKLMLLTEQNNNKGLLLDIEFEDSSHKLTSSIELNIPLDDYSQTARDLRFLQSYFHIDGSTRVYFQNLIENAACYSAINYLFNEQAEPFSFVLNEEAVTEYQDDQAEQNVTKAIVTGIADNYFGVIAAYKLKKMDHKTYRAIKAKVLEIKSFGSTRPNEQILNELEEEAFNKYLL